MENFISTSSVVPVPIPVLQILGTQAFLVELAKTDSMDCLMPVNPFCSLTSVSRGYFILDNPSCNMHGMLKYTWKGWQ